MSKPKRRGKVGSVFQRRTDTPKRPAKQGVSLADFVKGWCQASWDQSTITHSNRELR